MNTTQWPNVECIATNVPYVIKHVVIELIFLQYSVIVGIVIILVIAGAIVGYVRRGGVRFSEFYYI